jgi:GGDEF domain-containing protein
MKTIEVSTFGKTLEERFSAASREDLLRAIHALEHDAMTGLYRRETFQDKTNAMLTAARGDNTRVGYLLIDLDHFKRINDTYGHAAGDAAIAHVAQTLRDNVRNTYSAPAHERRSQSNSGASDIVGRLTEETVELGRVGGDELGIALYNVTAEQAYAVAERLHQALRENPLVYNGKSIQLTMSIGAAVTTATATTWDDLYHGADQALYRAKRNGRNRTDISPHGLAAVHNGAGERVGSDSTPSTTYEAAA